MAIADQVIPLAVASAGHIVPGRSDVDPLCVATEGHICNVPDVVVGGGGILHSVQICPEGQRWDPVRRRCVPLVWPPEEPEPQSDPKAIARAIGEAIEQPRGHRKIAHEIGKEIDDD